MVGVHKGVHSIKNVYLYGRWLFVGLLLLATIFIPYKIATNGQIYPDLNLLLTCYSIASFLWIVAPFDFMTVTAQIETREDGFWTKKIGRKASWYPYSAIVAHNERPNSTKIESFDELTVYLTDNWFVLRSNEYKDYSKLKVFFTQYGTAVRHKNVITVPERNLIRWLIGGTVILITANIGFGFLAHNVTDGTPAQLITVTNVVSQAKENKVKGRLKGVTITLRAYPDLSFYLSRRDYDSSLESLLSAIGLERPIILTIRESDFRKKLSKTEPLTFGDKYSNFKKIEVFAAEQANRFRIVSPSPVYEQKRANPLIRTFLLSILLVLCWTIWVYVDQHRLLRTT